MSGEQRVSDMDDEEIRFAMGTRDPNSTLYRQLQAELNHRRAHREAELSRRLVKSTAALAWATWALVGVTVVLAAGTITQVWLMLKAVPK